MVTDIFKVLWLNLPKKAGRAGIHTSPSVQCVQDVLLATVSLFPVFRATLAGRYGIPFSVASARLWFLRHTWISQEKRRQFPSIILVVSTILLARPLPWYIRVRQYLTLFRSQDLKDFGREAGSVSYADIDRDAPGEG